MAKRISGRLEIDIKFDDKTNQYRARVCPRPRVKGTACAVVHVSMLAERQQYGVDNPKAYDSAAKAALSFASSELQALADNDGSGWILKRRR